MARIGPFIITVPDLRGTLFRTAVSIGLLAAACLGLAFVILKVQHDNQHDAPKITVSTAFSTVFIPGHTDSTDYVTTTVSGLSATSQVSLTISAFTAESAQVMTPSPAAVTSTSRAGQPGNYVLPTSTTSNNTALITASVNATITAAPTRLYTGSLITASPNMNTSLVNSTSTSACNMNVTMKMTSNNATMWRRADNWHLETLHVSGGQGTITASLPQPISLPALQLHYRDAFDSFSTFDTTYDTLGTATLTLGSPGSEFTTKTGVVIEVSGVGFTQMSVEAAIDAPATSTPALESAASKSRVVLVALATLLLFVV